MDEFSRQVNSMAQFMSPLSARVARYLDRNRASVLAGTATKIAASTDTSDATVIRTIQALGFDGLPKLKQALAASMGASATPATNMRQTLASIGKDTENAVDNVLDVHLAALRALRTKKSKSVIVAAVEVLHPARRIAVFGIGPSAHLAGYVALQLTRVGRECLLLDAAGWSLADRLLRLRAGDAVLMLAYGKSYREAQIVLSEAERLGLVIVLVTDSEASALARKATVVLSARRGRANQVAVHAVTLAALECVVLGLAATDGEQTLGQLANLDRLRTLLGRR